MLGTSAWKSCTRVVSKYEWTIIPRAVIGRYTAATSFSTAATIIHAQTSQALLKGAQQQRSMSLFCRQCEQTRNSRVCEGSEGVCGKSAETSACQDVLVHVIKEVSQAAQAKRQMDPSFNLDRVNVWTLAAAFSTLTNVNFSSERITEYIREGHALLQELNGTPSLFQNCKTVQDVEAAADSASVPARQEAMGDPDAFSLNEIATYGMKGMMAYACHVHQLRQEIALHNPQAAPSLPQDFFASVHEIWAKLLSSEADVNGLLATVLRVGELNAGVLAALDQAHTELLGVPTPSQVRTSAVKGKCILVSGHDMVDLYHLLKQTEGTGINVYTHGEMLPAHQYPNLAAFPHLIGNYGTAWQNQNFEFASFPGPIIVTTNCVIKPRRAYQDRLYTMNEVGYDGVKHIVNRDYSGVIEQALECRGFQMTIEPPTYNMVGFNHRAVLPLADQILEAAKTGSLERIFLIGGCDGSQFGRSYFTDLAEETPDSSLILTLGCAKNRIIHSTKVKEHNQMSLPNGTVIPRVLDMGQCNDSYSAVVVALELAKALGCTVNDLPLSLAISHLEQKAAAVLLTLLHLGVKNIRLGPSLPAYISPGVLSILKEKYNLMQIGSDAREDLKLMMEGK